MSIHDDDALPPELQRIADRLRDDREAPSGLELDLLKRRVGRRVSTRTRKAPMRSRVTALVVALATVGGTTGAAIATAPKGNGKQPAPQQHSASHHQYRPGKGCGDKNHHHERENECKKHHHGRSDKHHHGRSDKHHHGHSNEHRGHW